MILTYITVAFAAFNLLMWYLSAKKAEAMFQERYPGMKIHKSHWASRTISLIKGVVFAICPVINIVLAYIWLVYNDDICEKTVAEVYQKSKESELKCQNIGHT